MTFAQIISNVRSAAGAVKARVNNITAQSKGLDSAAVFELTGSVCSNLQDQINNTRQSLIDLATATSTAVSTVAIDVVVFPLTVASTTLVVPSPSSSGTPLIVFVTQDNTGGRLIVWDTNFRFTTANIDTTANKTSVFSFVSAVDSLGGNMQWFMTCIPLTGVS